MVGTPKSTIVQSTDVSLACTVGRFANRPYIDYLLPTKLTQAQVERTAGSALMKSIRSAVEV